MIEMNKTTTDDVGFEVEPTLFSAQKTVAVDLDTSNKLTEIRNVRMTKADAQVWDDKVKESGLTPSKFFRKAIIENQTIVVNKQKKLLSPGHRQILFLLAQESNNVNQIALNLNVARKSGKLSGYDFERLFLELRKINETADLITAELL